MTDRDRLIRRLNDWGTVEAEPLADFLLANGVIVPPCKVGDKVWHLTQQYNGTFRIDEGKISMLTQKADKSWHLRITVNSSVWGFTPNEIGTRYFLTKEKAEEKLKELKENGY